MKAHRARRRLSHWRTVFGMLCLAMTMECTGATASDSYGPPLSIVRRKGVGPTMAAATADGRLFTIGRGTLRSFALDDPLNPRPLGSLSGLGATRQIAVQDGLACITSRQDGAFLIDVHDAAQPRLLSRIDTIEVATGVAVSGRLLFIACRHHGVEILDIADPRHPLHLGIARTGEAQSVAVRDGRAYVGVWGTSELVVVDVRNPRAPKVTARCQLDGFGDGVFIDGECVYVATGHHSRERTSWHPRPGEPGYGRGHGLEIWRLRNPDHPDFIARIKTPPFYHLGNDMWSVRVSGGYAFLADTHNGMFVIDVSNPAHPQFAGHCQLPVVPARKLPDFAGGLAPGEDCVYVAGGWTDLYVVAAPGLAQPLPPTPTPAWRIPPAQAPSHPRFDIYACGGQVRDVEVLADRLAVVAAGSQGMHIISLPAMKRVGGFETDSFAMGVDAAGDLVLVAEERGGLSVHRHRGDGELELVGRYAVPGQPVRDVVAPPPGRFALVQVGLSRVDLVDLADPHAPRCVLTERGHGFIYHLPDDLAAGRYACLLWQLDGLQWLDLYGGQRPTSTGPRYRYRLGNGGTAPVGDRRLVTYGGGYLLVPPDEQRPPNQLHVQRFPGVRLGGKPFLFGHRLITADRASGEVVVADIQAPSKPRLIERLSLPGNPATVVLYQGRMLIANGYQGLWLERPTRAETAASH